MYYNTRRGCKVVNIEPFVLMIGHQTAYGISLAKANEILTSHIGTTGGYGYTSDGRTTVSDTAEFTTVFNYTKRDLVRVEPNGMRSKLHPHPTNYFAGVVNSAGCNATAEAFAYLNDSHSPYSGKLQGQVLVVRHSFLMADNDTELKQLVGQCFFDNESVMETLFATEPRLFTKVNKRAVGYEFMLVYPIPGELFDSHHTVMESQTLTCLTTMSISKAYAHPLDRRPMVLDVNADQSDLSGNSPLYATFEIVYHDNKMEPRFLNHHGKPCEISQVQDTSRQEGFYLHWFEIAGDGSVMQFNGQYLEKSKINEAHGFYLSFELALARNTLAQAQEMLRLQRQAMDDFKDLRTQVLKDLTSHAKASIERLAQITERSGNEIRAYAEKRVSEHRDEIMKSAQTIEKLQEELRDNKRVHEQVMQSRKEVLETIRLVPPILGVVAALLTLKKKK